MSHDVQVSEHGTQKSIDFEQRLDDNIKQECVHCDISNQDETTQTENVTNSHRIETMERNIKTELDGVTPETETFRRNTTNKCKNIDSERIQSGNEQVVRNTCQIPLSINVVEEENAETLLKSKERSKKRKYCLV